jgi:serine/threonine-protein kinase
VASSRGGAWAEDGTIVFAPGNRGVGLVRVSSAGGTPEPLTTLADEETTQRWPQVLPGGRGVLYTSQGGLVGSGFEDAALVVQPLPSGPRTIVQRGGYYGRYVPSGHLLYIREGTLLAAPFDLDRLAVTGSSVPVVEGIDIAAATGFAQFATADNGTLVYAPGQRGGSAAPLSWMYRDGKTAPFRAMSASWADPKFAPDGRQLAVTIADGAQSDVWVYDWARDTMSRLTFDPAIDRSPVWTPDGRRIVYASRRAGGPLNLYWQRADGTGEVQRLTESPNEQRPSSWHPSGKWLAFTDSTLENQDDLMILPMEGDDASGWKPGKPTVFLSSRFRELAPKFSPDGGWIAYQSDDSDRFEVYVRPFPGPGSKWLISTGGGGQPTWSRTGHELFYSAPDQRILLAPYVVEGDWFRAEKPRLWSQMPFIDILTTGSGSDYDLHPDGDRFALAVASEAQSDSNRDKLVFIINFFEDLRRIAPLTK